MARGRLVVLLVIGAVGGVAACSSGTSSKPLGMGDTVFVDVEASTLPPPSDADLDPDGTFARVDGSQVYGSLYDSYALLTVCPAPAGADAAATAPTDGAAGSVAYEADGAAAGCVPFPASCPTSSATGADCVCLFGAFAAQIPCAYPSCGVSKSGFSLRCPP
jgi:hypothetical protein